MADERFLTVPNFFKKQSEAKHLFLLGPFPTAFFLRGYFERQQVNKLPFGILFIVFLYFYKHEKPLLLNVFIQHSLDKEHSELWDTYLIPAFARVIQELTDHPDRFVGYELHLRVHKLLQLLHRLALFYALANMFIVC